MRIGVIGLGFMGKTHLEAWRKIPRASVDAVCSHDEKKLSGDLSGIQGNFGQSGEMFDFSAMRRYRNVSDLLTDADLDAVDICLPTHLHAPTALSALRAGKHVLLEKPMALTGAECDELLAASEKNGKLLMVAQVLRFFPSYRAVADAVRSGKYGPVRSAVFRRRCAAPVWNQWLGDRSLSGGGVFDLLIHDIDFVLHLLGNPAQVSATGYEDLANGIDIIDAHMLYQDGPAVLVTGGWHHRKSFPFSMEFTVVTDGATFEFDSKEGSGVTMYTADGEAHDLPLSGDDAFEAELAYFTDCCETGTLPALCPPEESAAAVKLAERMLKARENGGVVASAGMQG